ncbi:chorismate-binding protein [uncultured Eudoraea sp.]|uniref:chorismate-binding protein n=1 Tax=uncultured Eudoraea sp. TaxID=1035614 RepID=UPI00260C03E5|nr:chorismate-binding protein [uncultured Eudoraea sp.]
MSLDQFGSIETHWKSKLPLVAYRKPNTDKVISILQNEAKTHYANDFNESGFVFAPFDKDSPAILIRPDKQLTIDYRVRKFELNKTTFEPGHEKGRNYHLEIVNKGIQEIAHTKLQKVVLSRKIEVPVKSSPIQIFDRVLSCYPNALCYLWYHPKIGLWIGATPELLLLRQNSTINTSSLAGTMKNTSGDKPIWGKKELEEQVMVTQHITKQLRSFVPDLSVGNVNSAKAGNLWHLKTRISGTIGDHDLKSIIDALHPTPAVCGLPVHDAASFIKSHENYKREYYTGFLGELNLDKEKTAHLFVNLRCMQIRDKVASLYVGGGITRDSNPEHEWMETVHKSETMLNMVFN